MPPALPLLFEANSVVIEPADAVLDKASSSAETARLEANLVVKIPLPKQLVTKWLHGDLNTIMFARELCSERSSNFTVAFSPSGKDGARCRCRVVHSMLAKVEYPPVTISP